jgi:hypothetical protein
VCACRYKKMFLFLICQKDGGGGLILTSGHGGTLRDIFI